MGIYHICILSFQVAQDNITGVPDKPHIGIFTHLKVVSMHLAFARLNPGKVMASVSLLSFLPFQNNLPSRSFLARSKGETLTKSQKGTVSCMASLVPWNLVMTPLLSAFQLLQHINGRTLHT